MYLSQGDLVFVPLRRNTLYKQIIVLLYCPLNSVIAISIEKRKAVFEAAELPQDLTNR